MGERAAKACLFESRRRWAAGAVGRDYAALNPLDDGRSRGLRAESDWFGASTTGLQTGPS
jgi:hypothetical protein